MDALYVGSVIKKQITIVEKLSKKMPAFLVNYNFTPTWLLDSGLDYIIVDHSDSKEYLKDFPQERITYEDNMGQVDFPKLNYLINNYDNLPEVFLWGKTNLFKYITKDEYDLVKDNQFFTPLLTQNHKTYDDNNGMVCFYRGEMYYERADSWFFGLLTSKYVTNWMEWAMLFMLPCPPYIPFAPGGNYILTRERVHKYGVDYYKKMASLLPFARESAEAACAERSYFLMWN